MKVKSFTFSCNGHELLYNYCSSTKPTAHYEVYLGRKAAEKGWKLTELLDAEVNHWLAQQKGCRIVDIRHLWLGDFDGSEKTDLTCVINVLYEEAHL